MPGEVVDNTSLELSDLVNRVLDKGAVIAGSVTISVGDIDLIQLDLTVVLTAIETVRSAERRRRELQGEGEGEGEGRLGANADLPVLPSE